jgi:amino acid adenylation domain-containing protein
MPFHLGNDYPEGAFFPLSYGQRAMWFFWRLDPHNPQYHLPLAFRLHRQLDVASIKEALKALVARHAILRTTYREYDGIPVQIVHEQQEIAFQIMDASAWCEADLQHHLAEEAHRPFDLEHQPAFRVCLFTRTTGADFLLFNWHHICIDGHDFPVLLHEFASLYMAWKHGAHLSLLDPSVTTYIDYVLWQQDLLASKEGERLWRYWHDQLQSPPPVLSLPTDRPRPPVQTSAGALHPFQLSAEVTCQLRDLAQHEHITLSTILLAAFATLLYRYSGQEDLIIGVPRFARTQAAFEHIIGYFTNLCPIRAKMTNAMSVHDLLQQTRYRLVEARDHQDFPFPLMVERLHADRDPSVSPIFQVGFMYHKAPLAGFEGISGVGLFTGHPGMPIDAQGLPMELYGVPCVTSSMDIQMAMEDVRGVLHGWLQYTTDLFETATIERMITHYQMILAAMIANPEQALSRLSLVSPSEQHQLLVEWNQTNIPFPVRCVHELFEEQVERTPEAIALVFSSKRMTYRELNQQANQLARHLLQMGIGLDSRVGLYLERSLEMIVGMLGIWKAGGVYVPLDSSLPQERLSFLLEDADLQLVLTQDQLLASLSSCTIPWVCCDREWVIVSQYDDSNVLSCISPKHLAYIIYTSGSTGRPKGVMIEHRSLSNSFQAQQRVFQLASTDRVLQFASLSFDASIFEILLPWSAGAQLILAPREEILPGSPLTQTIRTFGISTVALVPSALAMLNPEMVPSLRTVISGGETCSRSLAERWSQTCRFFNVYGPTETTIWATVATGYIPSTPSTIGFPIDNTRIYILDQYLQPVPIGVPGEIYIGGTGLARGYVNRPDLTTERFIPHPFSHEPGARLYQTGDLARYLPSGQIDYLGRRDGQVKLRGFRIELEEIAAVLRQHPQVQQAVVTLREDSAEEKQLVAYVVTSSQIPPISVLRRFLQDTLPNYMIPSAFVLLEHLPRNVSGKLDLRALSAPEERPPEAPSSFMPSSDLERQVLMIWQDVLPGKNLSHDAHFFECGGHSLHAVQVCTKLSQLLGQEIPVISLFRAPVLSAFIALLQAQDSRENHLHVKNQQGGFKASPLHKSNAGIAIIGMAGRFPGADTIEALWHNLTCGIESITTFTEEEILAAGVDPTLLKHPRYVKRGAFLEGVEYFDAAFFGYTPREAELLDPQQRLFLECAWQALEHAGYCTPEAAERIGVFGGMGTTSYWFENLSSSMMDWSTAISNEKDFLATRVCHRLNLHGPGITVQTACSTSLVAVALACQQLLMDQCDLALAGGVSLNLPQKTGYLYQEGGILSPDGHCRVFDAQAQGTVRGSGTGIVVLKRLDVALADGDYIWGVIKGWGITNDGHDKASFTAPSIDGQARAIRQALALAEMQGQDIGYVETHGTGTPIGDPIEIAALTQAFQSTTSATGFCAIGSLKSNIGHLDAAAGVAGLIKTSLMLHHRQIPPSLHFSTPNSQIDFARTPFYVNTTLRAWEQEGEEPRCAGVSSFGIGGTNAHLIVEEAPLQTPSTPGRSMELLILSAPSASVLTQMNTLLSQVLLDHPEMNVSDIAFTLHLGRATFNHRQAIICADNEDAATRMQAFQEKSITGVVHDHPKLAFLFPGQGSTNTTNRYEIYLQEPIFRQTFEHCAALFQEQLGWNILDVLSSLTPSKQDVSSFIEQPILFSVEYALATWWMALGVHPQALIGYSLGEYAAACIAGVFSLQDAIALVAERTRLLQHVPQGAMLAVERSEAEVQPYLNADLSLALISLPTRCVLAGSIEAVQRMESHCVTHRIPCRRIAVTHAFHSPMMDPILVAFSIAVEKVTLHAPGIPMISTVTGTWMTPTDATDPHYWVRHLRNTIRFADGLAECFDEKLTIFLELGPGRALGSLVAQHPRRPAACRVFSPLRPPTVSSSELETVLTTLAHLWVAGVPIQWQALYAHEKRQRLPLPLYPFERQRYWIEPSSTPRELRPASVVITGENQSIVPIQQAHDAIPALVVSGPHQPPNETERKVMELFAQVLGYHPPSLQESFFTLGGDSLSALSLLNMIERTFQRPLAMAAFLRNPTISHVTQVLETVDPPQSNSLLVELQQGSTLPPLFLPPQFGGYPITYRHLAPLLGAEQPVYSFEQRTSDGSSLIAASIEEMATKYIQEMQCFQSRGPYFLAGHSMGGTIAFEMAQQLEQKGEEVAFLALLDTPANYRDIPYVRDMRSHECVAADLPNEINWLLWLLPTLQVAPHLLRDREGDNLVQFLLDLANAQGILPVGIDLHYAKQQLKILEANNQLLNAYEPKAYMAGRLTLFIAHDGIGKYLSHTIRDWAVLAHKGIDLQWIPGPHRWLTDPPYVSFLAERLQACLATAS